MHEFRAIGRSMRDAALHFDAANLELRFRREKTCELIEGFLNGGEFWFAGAADCDDEASHFQFENWIVLRELNKKQIESNGLRKTLDATQRSRKFGCAHAGIERRRTWKCAVLGPRDGGVRSPKPGWREPVREGEDSLRTEKLRPWSVSVTGRNAAQGSVRGDEIGPSPEGVATSEPRESVRGEIRATAGVPVGERGCGAEGL